MSLFNYFGLIFLTFFDIHLFDFHSAILKLRMSAVYKNLIRTVMSTVSPNKYVCMYVCMYLFIVGVYKSKFLK